MSALRLAILLAAISSVLACGDASLEALTADTGGRPTELCVDDSECAAGESCQFGLCVDPEPRAVVVSLGIEPPDYRDDLVRQQVTDLRVTLGSGIPDFELSRPIRVNGAVVYDDASGAPVSATVRFRGTSGIPGEAYSANTHTVSGGTDFEIELPPGTYDVTIIDDRPDAGRIIRRAIEVSPDAARARPCDNDRICQSESLVLPAPTSYVRIYGSLSRSTPQLLPVEGARIYAVSVDGRFESTDDITDESGRFNLLVPPGLDAVELRIRPADGEWVPTLTFPPITPVADQSTDLALSYGPWPDPLPYAVVVQPPGGAEGIASVIVTARAQRELVVTVGDQLSTVDARYEARAASDAFLSGEGVVLDLPAGPAVLSVLAGDGSFSPVVASIDVSEMGPSELIPNVIEPLPRGELSGAVVIARSGIAVEGAVVSASFLGTETVPAIEFGVPDGLLDATGETDASGRFVLPLVHGLWRLVVEAPESVGAARFDEVDVYVDGTSRFDVALQGAGAASGRVLDYLGRPVVGATVQAWSVEGETSRVLWRSTTDADGFYRLVLAGELGVP